MKFHRIVIKLGTSTLTAGTANLSSPRIVELVRQMAQLHELGLEFALVSSGAIAAGREHLNFPQLPKDIPIKQMLAAVGQPRLMSHYEMLFGLYHLKVGQILLTRSDLSDRRRYLNSRNTLEALLSQRVIPIVNENDSVATEEIRVGDNDNLSAMVANLIEADLLILLTDQAGLYTADPRINPDAKLIKEITSEKIPEEVWQAAGSSANHLGTGGMVTKLQAADLARRSGTFVVIAPGSEADVLVRVVREEAIGTRFTPVSTAVESRQRYLLAGGKAIDGLLVDEGAVQALRKGGSLLPVGVIGVKGKFDRGDVVSVLEASNHEVARGLANYSAAEMARIQGRHSSEIESILGYTYTEEIIHRNNLVLL